MSNTNDAVSPVGRTWELWAIRHRDRELWHVGSWRRVQLQRCQTPALQLLPIVHVLVEEILGDPYTPEITHYGWQYQNSDCPSMIQIRTELDPSNPKSALMLLDLCLPGGLDNAIERGGGHLVSLRITENPGGNPGTVP